MLTSREDQVVSLIPEGISNREIAEQLSSKENTVKKSLLRIYDKLGVSNRVELVRTRSLTETNTGAMHRLGRPRGPVRILIH